MLKSLFSRSALRPQWDSTPGRLLRDGTLGEAENDLHSVRFVEVRDRAAYQAYRDEFDPVLRKRRALERFLAWSQRPFRRPHKYDILPDGYPRTYVIDGKLLFGLGANAHRFETWTTRPLTLIDGLLSDDIKSELAARR